MKIKPIVTHRFVKSEDLNHHGTLFAGRTAEWFVEAGLMAATAYLKPQNIVCAKVHGMNFTKPVDLGQTIKFVSKALLAGRSSLVANVQLFDGDAEILNGFITFVNVDENGKSVPHGVTLEIENDEDAELQRRAMELGKK